MKPKMFIGSSVEALRIAHAIQENLEHDALCTVWTQGIFNLLGNALDNLLEAVEKFDFAVFVFQPDDITQIRDNRLRTVRDNIIFESGLFISRLGKDKVFFVIPRNSNKLHLPTDLLGMQPGQYEPQEKDENLLSALGPFCNKIRRQVQEYYKETEQKESTLEKDTSISSISKPSVENKTKTAKHKPSKSKHIGYGIAVDEFGNHIISSAPTDFFAYRITKAFPGIRGLHWFKKSKEALDRLDLLLKQPLFFEKSIGHGTTVDPIWWWRDMSSSWIEKLQRLSETRCLLDRYELDIDKVAVFHSNTYYKCFVYVEVNRDKPVGVCETTEEDIERMVSNWGYASEEYGLFDQTPITRTCYDDGAAVINGNVVDTSSAELRVRYLSKYNFLIASKFSPVNSRKFEKISGQIFNEILVGKRDLQELCDIIERLPRHRNDY